MLSQLTMNVFAACYDCSQKLICLLTCCAAQGYATSARKWVACGLKNNVDEDFVFKYHNKIFWSTAFTNTGWVWSTIKLFMHHPCCQLTWQHQKLLKKSPEPWFEPGAAGTGSQCAKCCAIPHSVVICLSFGFNPGCFYKNQFEYSLSCFPLSSIEL